MDNIIHDARDGESMSQINLNVWVTIEVNWNARATIEERIV
jgi:hypothetical protein